MIVRQQLNSGEEPVCYITDILLYGTDMVNRLLEGATLDLRFS